MNEEQKKQIEEIIKSVTDFLGTVKPNDKGQIDKGFIFIPIEGFNAGRPTVLGMCDSDLLGLKLNLLKKDMAAHVLRMKVMQSTQDKTEQEALLAEIK